MRSLPKVIVNGNEINKIILNGQKYIGIRDIAKLMDKPETFLQSVYKVKSNYFTEGKDVITIEREVYDNEYTVLFSYPNQFETYLFNAAGYSILSDELNYQINSKDNGSSIAIKKGILNYYVSEETNSECIGNKKTPAEIYELNNWRDECNHLINYISRNSNNNYVTVRNRIYFNLINRTKKDIKVLLEREKQRMKENGYSKSKISKLNVLDIIEKNSDLKNEYIKIVNDEAKKLNV